MADALTVAQLIALLSTLDPDLPVVIPGSGCWEGGPAALRTVETAHVAQGGGGFLCDPGDADDDWPVVPVVLLGR